MRRIRSMIGGSVMLILASSAFAADIRVVADKLLIIDKTAVKGTARVVFVAHDPNIQKVSSVDPAEIEATLQVYYEDRPTNYAVFRLPPPWLKNTPAVAKYLNTAAPTGGGVKVGVVKPNKIAKVIARSLGDLHQIDIASPPVGGAGIIVILTITDPSDGSTQRLCTKFTGIEHKTIAKGVGRKVKATIGSEIQCGGGTTILMQPDLAGGFFSMPWPNDIRLNGDGTIDLAGYPGRAANSIYNLVLTNGSAVTKGFGTNAAIFLQSSAALAPAALPSPDDTTIASSPILLVNLDDTGTPPMPLMVDFRDDPTTYRPGNLLTLLPYPGHPLEEETRYAVIVLEGLVDAYGIPLLPSPLLAELDEPWDAAKPVGAAAWAALQAQRDEVLDYIDQHTSWDPDEVVAFSVFTTQDTTSDMSAVAAAVAALPPPTPVSRGAGDCTPPALRASVSGLLDLPKWQAGPYPYDVSGGGIVVIAGQAVQQDTERVVFEMTFPCGAPPVGGWPILLFMDGTGGFAESAVISELGLGPLPYVVASIAPLYSGDRAVMGALPDLLFFNYLNPLAGRTNQIQQAADMIYLKRIVQNIVLSAAETNNGTPVDTNDDIAVITGHSQGALTIPLVLAVDPDFDGGFISAGGAGFYHSIIHRADVRALVEEVLASGPGELNMFHPVIHALQTLAEVGDSANYARHVDVAHIVSVGGAIDGCSPLEVIAHLGTALGLEVANPLFQPFFGSSLLEPPIVALPVTGNLADGRTGVTIQLDTGHFGASTNPLIGRFFVESLASGGTPTVDPGTLSSDMTPGCAGRFDPL